MEGEQNKILYVLEVKTTAGCKTYTFQIDICSLDGSRFKNIAEKLQLIHNVQTRFSSEKKVQ